MSTNTSSVYEEPIVTKRLARKEGEDYQGSFRRDYKGHNYRCWQAFLFTAAIVLLFVGFSVMLALRQTAHLSYDPETKKLLLYSFHYFFYCFLGGFLSGLSHIPMLPVDIVKCRMQTGEFKSITEGFRRIYTHEAKLSPYISLFVFSRGFLPTFFGYCGQGCLKYGLYEILKYLLGGAGSGSRFGILIYLFSSCLAEIVADLALAPWEAVKVKMQTNKHTPTSLSILLPMMWEEEGIHAFYKGLVPLWFRQVPLTMMKFATFEKIVAALHYFMNRDGGGSNFKNLSITILGGIMSGVLCTLVSHPGDVIVSRMNQKSTTQHTEEVEMDEAGNLNHSITTGTTSVIMGGPLNADNPSMLMIAKQLGWRGLWKGLGARIYMICCITALQWFVYDTFKVSVGLPTTGKTSK